MTPELLEAMQKTLDGMIAKISIGWCQGVMAKGKDGRPVPWESPDASAWCAEGALLATAEPKLVLYLSIEIGRLVRQRTGRNMVKFNDRRGRTQQEVIDLLVAIRKSITPPENT